MKLDVSKLRSDAIDVAYIAGRLEFHISTIYGSSLTGAQKLDAVKQVLDADPGAFDPKLASKFDQLRPILTPAISGLVTIWRIAGFLTTVVKAAEPVSAALMLQHRGLSRA